MTTPLEQVERQYTVGELITYLRIFNNEFGNELPVVFDFDVGTTPSWAGPCTESYPDLALTIKRFESSCPTSLADFITLLTLACNNVFTGPNGRPYPITRNTKVWAKDSEGRYVSVSGFVTPDKCIPALYPQNTLVLLTKGVAKCDGPKMASPKVLCPHLYEYGYYSNGLYGYGSYTLRRNVKTGQVEEQLGQGYVPVFDCRAEGFVPYNVMLLDQKIRVLRRFLKEGMPVELSDAQQLVSAMDFGSNEVVFLNFNGNPVNESNPDAIFNCVINIR